METAKRPNIEPKLSHIALVEKCRAQDRQAQLDLYRKYCDGMFGVAMRFLKNPDDAEDVVQESFIKAFVCLEQFKGEVSFGAWLKRIVVNGCIDFVKKKSQVTEALDEEHTWVAEGEESRFGEGISLDQIRAGIESLSGKYRFVVQLFLVEGYDHGEIAQILDISEVASRSRLLRGKALLQVKLKDLVYGR